MNVYKWLLDPVHTSDEVEVDFVVILLLFRPTTSGPYAASVERGGSAEPQPKLNFVCNSIWRRQFSIEFMRNCGQKLQICGLRHTRHNCNIRIWVAIGVPSCIISELKRDICWKSRFYRSTCMHIMSCRPSVCLSHTGILFTWLCLHTRLAFDTRGVGILPYRLVWKKTRMMWVHDSEKSLRVRLAAKFTRSSAVADRPRDASCHWIFR